MKNLFSSRSITIGHEEYRYFPLDQINNRTGGDLTRLPYCIRILLENALRNDPSAQGGEESIQSLANWSPSHTEHGSTFFMTARILLQDLTGVPLVVDLASLRSAAERAGKDPARINPLIPVDLVIDHSIQVDHSGTSSALSQNTALEYSRNHERYRFLKWAQASIKGFRVIPPASGIVHQVNLEFLTSVVMTSEKDGQTWIYPDTVFGTDSHTTMVNGLGVLGWGVGGIEAAAAMLGQPVEILIPDVIGIKISGKLNEGSSPTDIVLTLTRTLRKLGVVNKMVEFFGPGIEELTVPNRAMLANMAPEYGATVAYFPVDDAVINYLRLTGRDDILIELTEKYYKTQGLFRNKSDTAPHYSQEITLDLSTIQPSLAGPKRPQDRVSLDEVARGFTTSLSSSQDQRGFSIPPENINQRSPLHINHEDVELEHGSIVIAAITSCTNTSDPFAMISAGLLAKNAVAVGLRSKPYVKTSLAPGSRTVVGYLSKAGLLEPLEKLGFQVAGYGCMTCIGNSGPLDPRVSAVIEKDRLVAVAVISGNRNFEGRVHPLVQANYLASPALVVAYAIIGSIRNNLIDQPLGTSKDGNSVYLKDIWPSNQEVESVINQVISPQLFSDNYAHITEGDEKWQAIPTSGSVLYPWETNSTYILETPFLHQQTLIDPHEIKNARILAIFGDSITTDHISPAGTISLNSPAADYLRSRGISPLDFNTYGSRRGNHEVMMRGTFANIRIKNKMLTGKEGGFTIHYPDGETMTIFDAAQKYINEGRSLVILAGKEYGSGSSRDWAAKGPLLLGVKAIIAESFERIHRSNLVGMGILPLSFKPGENAASLGITGSEQISIINLDEIAPSGTLQIKSEKPDGSWFIFDVNINLNTLSEVNLWKKGGLLPSFLENWD